MQKAVQSSTVLSRAVRKCKLSLKAKTWPSYPHLGQVETINLIWSMHHPKTVALPLQSPWGCRGV